MIEEIQELVAKYVTANADLSNWMCIRECYSQYAYLAFASLIATKLERADCANDVYDILLEQCLENKDIIKYISLIKDAGQFVDQLLGIFARTEDVDINSVYQGFLARDYSVNDGKFLFQESKNVRDVLGSYYTQEDFAEEIASKALMDYVDSAATKAIRIADYSCGGGAFLVAASKLCLRHNLVPEIFGYDVDPIAVLITRYRLATVKAYKKGMIHIYLGNPLLRRNSTVTEIEKIRIAFAGRYYHDALSIVSEANIDVVLGNPPWEKIRFEEKKFLNHYVDNDSLKTKSDRDAYIGQISTENRGYFDSFVMDYNSAKKFLKSNSFFKQSNCGELNTYALFTELCWKSLSSNGISGIIIKTSLLKMPVYSTFFSSLTRKCALYEVYMFSNRRKIFNIDSREEFSVIFLGCKNLNEIGIAFDLEDYRDFGHQEKIYVSHDLLRKLNPETGMIPNIKSGKELEFLITLYDGNRTFDLVYPNCRYGRLVHLTNHSEYIEKSEKPGFLPVYEGKFIELYTAKYATFGGMEDSEKYKNKASAKCIIDPSGETYPEARFYIEESIWKGISKNFEDSYVVAWRSLTSATNKRTMLATILPLVPTCQSIQLLQLSKYQLLHVVALFNSIVFDYIVRLKMAGLDLTQTIIKQIPVPMEEKYLEIIDFDGITDTIEAHINSRIKMLYSSDYRMDALFVGVKTYKISDTRRQKLIAEIDRLIAKLYGLSEAQLKYIAKSFIKFYSNNEIEEFF